MAPAPAPTPTSAPAVPRTIKRAAVADHLAALGHQFGAAADVTYNQAAREAGLLMPLRKVTVALDQIVNRSQDALTLHGILPSAVMAANAGDLAEAERAHRVLLVAAAAAATMISATRSQVAAAGAPVASVTTPTVTPGPAAPLTPVTHPSPTKPKPEPIVLPEPATVTPTAPVKPAPVKPANK